MGLEAAYKRFDQMMSGMSEDGRTIGVKDAYTRSAWVYGAISIIAESVARTPFEILQGETPLKAGPLVKLSEEPNAYDNQNTSTKFRTAYLTELLLNGAVMKVFTEISGQTPLEMTVFPRSKFTAEAVIDKNGKEVVRRWHLNHRGGRNTYIPGDEINHDVLYNPLHDWEGLAPLAAAIAVVNNDVNVSEFANRFFVNDASPGLIFSSDDPGFDQDQAKIATQLWNEKHRGVGKAWKTAFLGHGLRPFKVGMGLDPRILGALKGLTREEIVTGIFKVPLSIFGQSDIAGNQGVVIGGRGSASDSEKEGFLINVIIPWARRYDEDFNKDIAWRFGATLRGRHNFSENPILENRRLARAQTAAELLQYGIPINEMIRWLRLELSEVGWGDEWLVQDNLIPASVLVKAGDKLLEKRSNQSAGGQQSSIAAGMEMLADPSFKAHRDQFISESAEKIVTIAEERIASGLHEHEKKIQAMLDKNHGKKRETFGGNGQIHRLEEIGR